MVETTSPCVHVRPLGLEQSQQRVSELLQSDRCQLVVVRVETGDRFSPEAVTFFEGLAALRFPSFVAWQKRWSRMLSISCCRAFCGSLILSSEDPMRGTDGADLAFFFSACVCRLAHSLEPVFTVLPIQTSKKKI